MVAVKVSVRTRPSFRGGIKVVLRNPTHPEIGGIVLRRDRDSTPFVDTSAAEERFITDPQEIIAA
jgi:hypothetical protein